MDDEDINQTSIYGQVIFEAGYTATETFCVLDGVMERLVLRRASFLYSWED